MFVLVPAMLLAVIAGPVGAVEPAMEVRLEGRLVLDGEADDRLRTIGRQAAGDNLVLQVSAPDLWERRILEPIRAGAGDKSLTIKYVNALSDVVTITGVPADQAEDPLETLKRITQNAKARAAGMEDEEDERPVAAQRRRPEARAPSQRPEIERPAMDMPEVKVDRPRAVLPQTGAGRNGAPEAIASAGRPANGAAAGEDRVETADEAAPAPSEGGETGASGDSGAQDDGSGAGDDGDVAERERFERLYNDGRTISASLAASDLRRGDLVFTGNHHNVVVRRGLSTRAYWLEGEPPDGRLQHEERNRYRVRTESSETTDATAGSASGSAQERERFERLYNGGRTISGSLRAGELEPGDALYVGRAVTAVVRREGLRLAAYWLAEPVALDQAGIEHEHKNKYVVVGDVR